MNTQDMYWQEGIGTTAERVKGLPDPIPPYSAGEPCRKCDSLSGERVVYRSALRMHTSGDRTLVEWLELTCLSCGYQHVTATADASPP